MRNLKMYAALGCAALFSLSASNAIANTVSIDSFDNGWYATGQVGSGTTYGVSNINVGWSSTTGSEYRNWLAFNLSSLAGQNITSATLTFYGNNGNYATPVGGYTKTSETLGLFDYTGNIDALVNNQSGSGVFNDLGSGTSYGQATVSGPGSPIAMFTVTLNPDAIAALNAAANNATDQRFAVGGSLLSIAPTHDGNNWYSDAQLFAIFGSQSALDHAAYLTMQTSPVPLPAGLPLLLSGLGAMGFLGRRNKLKAA